MQNGNFYIISRNCNTEILISPISWKDEGMMHIQKYVWVSNDTKPNANGGSVPSRTVPTMHVQ